MYKNCSLRSGWSAPSRVLAFPCRLYSNSWSKNRIDVMPIGCPWRVNSVASRRRLLHVQRSGDSGSPRTGSIKASNCSSKWGSVNVHFFRPPPGFLDLFVSRGLTEESASSAIPFRIVLCEMPVACLTRVTPPQPSCLASAAAQRRHARSERNGCNCLNFVWVDCMSSLCINPL